MSILNYPEETDEAENPVHPAVTHRLADTALKVLCNMDAAHLPHHQMYYQAYYETCDQAYYQAYYQAYHQTCSLGDVLSDNGFASRDNCPGFRGLRRF